MGTKTKSNNARTLTIIAKVRLYPSNDISEVLRATLGACNAAATEAASIAHEEQILGRFDLQKRCYTDLRANHGIGAQMAVRALSVASGAMKSAVSNAQRAGMAAWSFEQLRGFVAYKATAAGVVVAHVNPAYTSRTCSRCGCRDKRNRRSQAKFRCVVCKFESHADVNAATNISRAAVNRPDVPGVEVEASRGHRSSGRSLNLQRSSGTSPVS